MKKKKKSQPVLASINEDSLIEEMVRDLIEEHLDEKNCADAMAWLDKVVAAYEQVKEKPDTISVAEKIAL